MVSTRSRSALNSGDAAIAAAQGQPEVSSTPRRSSSRLAGRGATTPSGRTRQARTASKTNKAAELAAIPESPQQQQQQQQGARQAQDQAGNEQQHVAQQAQPPAPETQQQQHQQQQEAEVQADSQPQQQQQQPQEQASTPVPVGQPGIEELGGTIGRTACERSNSQDPGESAQDADMEVQHPESEAEQQPWGKAAPSDLAMQPASLKGLGADASLLDKVAAEMFAALEGAFGGAESDDSDSEEGSRSSSGDEGEEDGVSAGEDHVEQMQEQVQEETGREAATAAVPGSGAYDVPRHLRWEPELALPGATAPQQHRRAQGQPKQQQQEPLAKQLHVLPRDERALQKAQRGAAPDTAGKQWFDLPATAITDEVKRDLRMLRLRTAFDPKSFYKKLDSTKFPKHFQVGTVVEGAADFYSARLTKGERKRTFTEEVMADPHLAEVRKKRFSKLQEEKSYWANKKAARKTENERLKKKPRKPKH